MEGVRGRPTSLKRPVGMVAAMVRTAPAALVVALFALTAGCIQAPARECLADGAGGAGDQGADGPRQQAALTFGMSLRTGADGPGWRLTVACAARPQPLGAHGFRLETPADGTIVVEPVGTWKGPRTFYGQSPGDPGGELVATEERPSADVPAYRFHFEDTDTNAVFGEGDVMEIAHRAANGTDFQDPFPAGTFHLLVTERGDGRTLARVMSTFPGQTTGAPTT